MTNEYKKKVLEYLCGKINKESGNNVPQYSAKKTITNNLYDQLKEIVGEYTSTGDYNVHAIGYYQSTTTDKIYLYGYSNNDRHPHEYGWIAILKNNLYLENVIDTYTSNVIMGRVLDLIDDELGRVVLLEYQYNENNQRILCLNNISVKDRQTNNYIAKIRKSYVITDTNITLEKIKKSKGNNFFALAGRDTSSSEPIVILYEIKDMGINGIERKTYPSTRNIQVADLWADWNENNELTAQIVGYDYADYEAVTFLSLEIGYSILIGSDYQIPTTRGYIFNRPSIILIKMFEAYYGAFFQQSSQNGTYPDEKRLYVIYRFNIIGRWEILYHKETPYNEDEENDTSNAILYATNDLNIFYAFIYWEGGRYPYSLEIGKIVDYNVYPDTLGEIETTSQVHNEIFIVANQYNLYTYLYQVDNDLIKVYQIYNNYNYNGLPFSDETSLIPKTSILYNAENEPIFARNLYNKSVTNRTTISTVEIPNTMLNNGIYKEDLLGNTNIVLVSNSQTINKNIYEKLYINFINSIQIRNDNDVTNKIINTAGAIRLNQSISNDADYDDAKGININYIYENGTTYSYNILEEQVTINNLQATINLYVYVPAEKKISYIEIKSADKKTTYQTIKNLNLEKGKLYNIKQNVKIQ